MATDVRLKEYEDALRRFCRAQRKFDESHSEIAERQRESYTAGLVEHEGFSYADAYVELGRRHPELFPERPRLSEADPVQFMQERHSELVAERPELTSAEAAQLLRERWPSVHALAEFAHVDPGAFREQCSRLGGQPQRLDESTDLCARIVELAHEFAELEGMYAESRHREAAERQRQELHGPAQNG